MTIWLPPNCQVWTGSALVYPFAQLWLQAPAPLGLPNPVLRLRGSELLLPKVLPVRSQRESPTAEPVLLPPARLCTRSTIGRKPAEPGKHPTRSAATVRCSPLHLNKTWVMIGENLASNRPIKQISQLVDVSHRCGEMLHTCRAWKNGQCGLAEEGCGVALQGLVLIPFKRKVFLVSLSWCRSSHGKTGYRQQSATTPSCPPEIHFGE